MSVQDSGQGPGWKQGFQTLFQLSFAVKNINIKGDIDWAFFTYYYNFIFFMKYCIIFVCRKNIYIFYYILLFRYLFRILNDCKVWVLYNYTDMDSCSPAAKSWKMRIYQTNTSIKKDALFKNPTEHCKTLQ